MPLGINFKVVLLKLLLLLLFLFFIYGVPSVPVQRLLQLNNVVTNCIIVIISFTQYPAHIRLGRGNLVLRHRVHHFLSNFRGIAC